MEEKMLIGLGNPGKEFEDTYHNAGVLALGHIMRGGDISLKKYKKIFDYGKAQGNIFVRPLTYMNESGEAAKEALKKFKMKPAGLVVLHDDSDLTLGDYKISFGRSSAGHKGVQSIIDALGTNEFSRIRIGIRPARETHRKKASEFALKPITPGHRKILDGVFVRIADTLAVLR